MNIYALIHGLNSLVSLAAASIILFSRSKKPIHLGHGWFSLLVFGYTFPYFLWGIQNDRDYALCFFYPCLDAVSFIHVAYFHYVLILSNNLKKFKKWLAFGYLSSFVFATMNHFDLLYDLNNVRQMGPFEFFPIAKPYLPALITVQCFYVLFAWLILWRTSRTTSSSKSINLKSYLMLSVVGWLGGLLNWTSFWDGPFIPPIGNVGVMLLVVGTFYLIFKHDFLELDTSVKRGFVYALLTLFVTMIFTTFILIAEHVSSSYFGYTSVIASLLAGMVITFFFNPIRSLIDRAINRLTFGKDVMDLSAENTKLQLEMQKQDRLKAVATLASGMAHEVKNPLAAIRTFVEYLPKKYDDPSFRKKFEKVLLEEVDRIDSIVRQLLDFSKPQLPTFERVKIGRLLDETLETLNSAFLKQNIEAAKDYGDDLEISGDKHQLKQVFLNLFLNAMQAMPQGGKLMVCCEGSGERVVISIADTGAGIPKEKLGRIFEPFYTTKESGTGLGLSIVKEIVEAHKGKVWVESTVGSGTKVMLSLARIS